MSKMVRRFSMAGPCIVLGECVKSTDKFLVYIDKYTGKKKRIGHGRGLAHAEPCSSCRDHPRTTYPHGYMD